MNPKTKLVYLHNAETGDFDVQQLGGSNNLIEQGTKRLGNLATPFTRAYLIDKGIREGTIQAPTGNIVNQGLQKQLAALGQWIVI